MPLEWSVDRRSRSVLATGTGTIGRPDIEDFLAATIEAGSKGHAKLIDLTMGDLTLGRDDLDGVARWFIAYDRHGDAGPVALVVRGALNIDMAVLLKQRVGARSFRVFVTNSDAEAWLAISWQLQAA